MLIFCKIDFSDISLCHWHKNDFKKMLLLLTVLHTLTSSSHTKRQKQPKQNLLLLDGVPQIVCWLLLFFFLCLQLQPPRDDNDIITILKFLFISIDLEGRKIEAKRNRSSMHSSIPKMPVIAVTGQVQEP